MEINLQALKKYLEGLSYNSFFNLTEYQNKFYLKKEIQSAFPELPDEVIFKSIDTVNIKLKGNYLSKKYILFLSGEIISLFNLKIADNDLN